MYTIDARNEVDKLKERVAELEDKLQHLTLRYEMTLDNIDSFIKGQEITNRILQNLIEREKGII